MTTATARNAPRNRSKATTPAAVIADAAAASAADGYVRSPLTRR